MYSNVEKLHFELSGKATWKNEPENRGSRKEENSLCELDLSGDGTINPERHNNFQEATYNVVTARWFNVSCIDILRLSDIAFVNRSKL